MKYRINRPDTGSKELIAYARSIGFEYDHVAANGPTKSCRIGPPADITLRNITSVIEVTPDAEAKWKAGAWS